ncbi:hypothetical protein ACH4ZX_35730 [Streptomyces sp. NPDC020490]|uniref:hypothetical protein n=1 Tax=Streptomyces sp. NPDC020490 TaxID=3365078 RepID=UPI003797F855
MPTDHACHAAADAVARGLRPLRDRLAGAPGPGGGPGRHPGGRVDGAAGLLAFLDGLHAELSGALTGWHSTLGDRILGALGLSPRGPGGPEGRVPAARPSGWEALGLVRRRAEEVLTALSGRSYGGAGLSRRLELVEDAFAGALRRLGVPARESADHAAELAAATGSLFGLHPPPRRRAAPPEPQPQPAPAAPRTPGTPFMPFPRMSDWSQGGLP